MDNLFDYLIFGILILSAFSSLFKKKPKGEGKKPSPLPLPEIETDEDMLRWEQENFPQEEIPRRKEKIPLPQEPATIESTYKSNYDYHYTDAVKDKKLAEEVKKDDAKIDEAAEKFLSSNKSYIEKEAENRIALTIRNKISSKDYLKEAFIISEILNKPVGLRIDG